MTVGVQFDTTKFDRDTAQMLRGMKSGQKTAAMKAARQIANDLRSITPVDTGALRRSIVPRQITSGGQDGAEVLYGTGLKYAWPVNARTNIVPVGISDAEDVFMRFMQEVAAKEANRV